MEYGKKDEYKTAKFNSVRNNEVGSGQTARILPRQLSTGSTRGTQTVGYGDTKIDGSNNVITVGDSIKLDGNNGVISVTDNDGSQVGMGSIPDTDQFGFSSTNSQGQVIMTIVNGTMIMNDTVTDRVLIGKDEGGF